MPTINSMLTGTYSLYKTAQNNGTLFQSNKNNNDMFQRVFSASQDANNTLSGLQGVSANTKELISSYEEARTEFNEGFDDAMGALRKASSAIKSMNFNVGNDALTTTENEDGTTTTTKSKELTEALKSVEDMVKSYNEAIDFFTENSAISKRVGRMQTLFSDTTYRADSYGSVGISVNSSTGKLSIDEEKLTKTMMESPERVSRVLGSDGLAAKAESHMSIANSQKNQLFPSVNSMIGPDLKSGSVYSGSSLLNLSKYSTTGGLLNMMG